jgi:hypothetical protein
MLRYIPGLAAALAAFIALKLVGLVLSLGLQFLVFVVTYLAVVFAVDAALTRYGQAKNDKK